MIRPDLRPVEWVSKMTEKPVAIVTNVTEYAGPASVAALTAMGRDVVCHDQKFSSEPLRLEYEERFPGTVASANLEPEKLVDEAMARFGRLDAIVSNDFTLLRGAPVDEIGTEAFRAFFEALTVSPFRLCAAAARVMKPQRRGQIVLITSGAGVSNPVATFAEGMVITAYITARKATNALARSLAVELAAFGIQVNAVAVSRLYSQTFFPSPL